jgi:G3E family GTPase
MTDSILSFGPRLEPVSIPGREPVPVTLLIGFLGAGKTTLLNRILNDDHGLRVGVLVNDFGAINIDADLIEGVEENTISLTNGCVCCEIRDDLVVSIEQLLSRMDTIDYIILEASGVADPESIVMTFLEHRYRELLRLDSITCIVDAEGIFAHADNPDLTMLKLRQIGYSDMVVLNKVDLVGPENVKTIKEWIGSHLNRIRIVEAIHCEVPLEILLAVGRFDPANVIRDHQDGEIHTHGPVAASLVFDTWSYETDKPLALEALRTMVRRELPAAIYRCKGIVYAADSPEKRLTLQTVGRRTEIIELDEWGKRQPGTLIVAIGAPGEINSQQLTEQFDRCIAERQPI